MAAYCLVYGVIHFTSPAGWLPVHRDQLRAQRSVTSMGKLHLLPLHSLYNSSDAQVFRFIVRTPPPPYNNVKCCYVVLVVHKTCRCGRCPVVVPDELSTNVTYHDLQHTTQNKHTNSYTRSAKEDLAKWDRVAERSRLGSRSWSWLRSQSMPVLARVVK